MIQPLAIETFLDTVTLAAIQIWSPRTTSECELFILFIAVDIINLVNVCSTNFDTTRYHA